VKDTYIRIRTTTELKQAAQQHAQETGRTLAGLIEWLLRQELKKNDVADGQEGRKDMKTLLMERVLKLNEKYEELMDAINQEKAQGNLSKLLNLKRTFDETFDQFFDNEDLRKKYDDWDCEEDCIKMEKSNSDLLKELDEEDLKSYIKFYENYIEELEDELNELRD
jgi:hypothetical protein